MARAGGWEFFLTRWGLLYDAVAGSVKAAAQTQPQLTQAQVRCHRLIIGRSSFAIVAHGCEMHSAIHHVPLHAQAAMLDVLIKKAIRAKEVLQQVQ